MNRPDQQDILALKGKKLSVAALLAHFGTRLRNHHTVPIITEALREAGLGTAPSFTTCNFATEVLVIAMDSDELAAEEDESDLTPGTLPQHSFKIGDIPSACGGVHSVPATAPISQAIFTMRAKNFSQLPVIDGTSDLKGVLTWNSIAACYEKGKTLTLANAMLKDPLPVAEVHQDLFPRLSEVEDHGYLLVRSNSGIIQGIITGADITSRFHSIAWPFFLVGEIEFRLRRCLGPNLNGDPVRAVQSNKKTGDVADLMFGEYLRLLDPDQTSAQGRANAATNWGALGWTVNRAQFVHQLRQVKSIRNSIAHFDDKPLSPQQLDELTEFSGLLKQLM
jgi:hypothetical protein